MQVLITREELREHTFAPQLTDGGFGDPVPGWYVMFKLAACEKCGKECQAANAVNVRLGQNTEGLSIRKSEPPELGYCETFEGAVCPTCYIDPGADEYDCDKCGADMREVSCECYAPIMNHFDY